MFILIILLITQKHLAEQLSRRYQ